MRVLVQRVKSAKVTIGGRSVAEISQGLLLLVGVGKEDGVADSERLSQKILNLRIFDDADGKMNLNVKQVEGEILSVPQFTLYADTLRGNRPGFEEAADPAKAEELWGQFNSLLRKEGTNVKGGTFGACTEVGLVNDGPVTIWLDSKR